MVHLLKQLKALLSLGAKDLKRHSTIQFGKLSIRLGPWMVPNYGTLWWITLDIMVLNMALWWWWVVQWWINPKGHLLNIIGLILSWEPISLKWSITWLRWVNVILARLLSLIVTTQSISQIFSCKLRNLICLLMASWIYKWIDFAHPTKLCKLLIKLSTNGLHLPTLVTPIQLWRFQEKIALLDSWAIWVLWISLKLYKKICTIKSEICLIKIALDLLRRNYIT
jgi:hypothetical protein